MTDAPCKEPLPRSAGPIDEIDPELASLPAPPSGRRLAAMVSMGLAIIVALGLAATLRHDVAYFFSGADAPVELGSAATVSPATLRPNTFVRVRGSAMMARTVRYRRLLSGQEFLVFPLAGQRTLFVHVPASHLADVSAEFEGRLVTFGQMGGRLDGVRRHFTSELGVPVTAESFVLMAGETPRTLWWAPVLAFFFALFVVLDAWLVVRWFRATPRATTV